MSSMQDTKRILSEHKVIPDVLPEQVTLSYNLTLKWPSATLDAPGKQLHREETQDEPQVFLDPAPTEPLNNLVLICTDPDLMMNDDTYFGQVRHWLYTNISTNQDGSLNFANVAKRSPWVGPAPLPNYVYPRPHRYVFILASSTNKVEVTPEDLRELQKPYVVAMAGKQGHVQDIKDRWGFNAYQLIENKGLKVEAVNFIFVGGTLKSAAANAAMMGQGMVDKVLGH